MRKGLCALWLAACAGTGCFSLPHFWDGNKPPAKPAPQAPAPAPAPEVMPEQVNDSNARQMADKLQQEVDQDGQMPAAEGESKNKGK
jgi:hypothetical protein